MDTNTPCSCKDTLASYLKGWLVRGCNASIDNPVLNSYSSPPSPTITILRPSNPLMIPRQGSPILPYSRSQALDVSMLWMRTVHLQIFSGAIFCRFMANHQGQQFNTHAHNAVTCKTASTLTGGCDVRRASWTRETADARRVLREQCKTNRQKSET